MWPATIQDSPRYAHRGLLLDTARHYEPIFNIQHTIDALSYAKFNVLHWHVVDSQSFPFESQAYPKLWDGSYTSQEKYTHNDIVELVEYGRARGIKVSLFLFIVINNYYLFLLLNLIYASYIIL